MTRQQCVGRKLKEWWITLGGYQDARIHLRTAIMRPRHERNLKVALLSQIDDGLFAMSKRSFSRHAARQSARRVVKRQQRSNKQVSFGIPRKQGSKTQVRHQSPFVPPEDWYEPTDEPVEGFEVIEQQPGPGYQHVVTEEEVRDRLAELPEEWLEPLQVVQLSRMTHKKSKFPCYGMQWGPAIYLYPIEESLCEYFGRPPKPSQLIEAKMYGGQWKEHAEGDWTLTWSEANAKDFYLNNVLIHELGHLLDDRNRSYEARERYAEWFAIEYGYRPTRVSRPWKRINRRHHRA